ncbi:unnamed protein product [Euphydryas editha]|uniref:Ion transport domain-containing protein n=1 Tax=Euphydryas editha TaxID=104508 RepID=A0AAU9V5F5_EUPED|nr:unnamed protein product [Euphydryas editha]
MIRSVSEPSLGTITGTIATAATGRASRINIPVQNIIKNYRGKRLWEGKFGIVTRNIVMAPWNMWWQLIIFIVVVYKYVVHLLLAYYFEKTYVFLDASILVGEMIFLIDVFIQLLHTFWPILKLHVRVYRRNFMLLAYDVASLMPLSVICKYYFILILDITLGFARD